SRSPMNAAQALAEEKRGVDELLDILRANKQITEQQYRTLKQRAGEEREQHMCGQAARGGGAAAGHAAPGGRASRVADAHAGNRDRAAADAATRRDHARLLQRG